MSAILVQYLKQIPLFTHLKDSQLKDLAARCRKASFKKGATVFERTDMSTELYIVSEGGMKAVLSDDEGDEIVLARFDKGAFFGELSLLDGKGRSATIVADKDSELFVLSRDTLLEHIMKDPKIAISLLAILVERLRKADEMIESLAFQEVGERLVRALVDGAERDDAGPRGFLKRDKTTHRELAALIGSSREAVSKCLKILFANGIVKEMNGKMLIAENALQLLKNQAHHA